MALSLAHLSEPLRDATWLTGRRAIAYCVIAATVFAVAAAAWVALSTRGVDLAGRPLGTDFLSFWAASKIALAGDPERVYDIGAHFAAQRAAFPGTPIEYAAYFYPPVFLLICLPLTLLPYFASLGLWLAATLYLYWRVVRSFFEDARTAALAVAAFPAVIINIGHGQNGFLTAALFGGGVLACGKRPILAGILFGCLVFKPHLAILIPFALAARGAWRTFAAAGATAVGLIALSVAVFGVETWRGFLEVSPLAREVLEQEFVGSDKMQSAFAAMRLLGGSVFAAYALQAAVAAAALALLVGLSRTGAKPLTQGAALVLASLLATPFLLGYDLTLLAIPLAWLFGEARRSGFLRWEKIVLLAAFVMPLVSRLIAAEAGIPVAPFVLAAVFLVVMRRGFAETRTEAAPEPDFRRFLAGRGVVQRGAQ